MRNNILTPVTGDDFYGRELQLAEAGRHIANGQSVILSAPRRLGKSSLARRILEQHAEKGLKTVYIDLEGVRTEKEFLGTLLHALDNAALWKKSMDLGKSALGSLVKSIKAIGPVSFDFSTIRDPYLHAAIAEAIDYSVPTVIVLDELTLFHDRLDREGSHDVAFILDWLRGLRQQPGNQIRWILSGSIGLHNFTGIRGLTHAINDLVPLAVDVMPSKEAEGLLSSLAKAEGLELDASHRSYLLDKIEWAVPYFIQLFIAWMVESHRAGKAPSRELVDEIYAELVASDLLEIWSQRLREYNGHELTARALLRELSTRPEGLAKEDLYRLYLEALRLEPSFEAELNLTETLNMLERDSYIARDGSRRRFRSALLRDWWRHAFVD